MTTPATTTPRTTSTERAIGIATTVAPIVTGVIAPMLDGGAAFTATITYGAAGGILGANYMNRLPQALADNLPAGDILRAHRSTMFISTLTTGIALSMGTLMDAGGTDALMAGILTLPSVPGIVSLGWWAAVGLVPWKLRNVLGREHHTAPIQAAPPNAPTLPPTDAAQIAKLWYDHISNEKTGTHKRQDLTIHTLSGSRWTGTITALSGASVTVTPDNVSSVYRKNADWITISRGSHAGERHITVNLVPPVELDTSTLQGAWRKWAARTGGVMAGTHLEEATPDPNTGGEVARVVANDTIDALPTPNMRDLVGALRTSHLLLSYEPGTNPRKAVIRLMKENPLRAGVPFPGPEALLPTEGGYFRLGAAVSGRPIRAQLLDPKLGARHLLVSGVTGSGKGGVLQLIALAAHLAGAVIIYADPKGSSNPAIEKMAAYTGLGEDGAMGALLLMEALVNHRIDLTGQLKQKNFDRNVMPHVVFILDEASTLLGEKAKHRKRATRAAAHIAKQGRSMGASEVLANQLLQLAEIGGDSAIRDNIVGSGGSMMLRSDSSQRHLIDLPPGMESVNPADIPRTWTGDDSDTLVYTDDVVIQDPESTFGLGYFMTTDGICAMGRTYDLEDATAYINPNRIAEPFDWPDWDDRHDLVAGLLAEGEDTDDDMGDMGTLFTGFDIPQKKPASTDDKILKALEDVSDPIGMTVVYKDKHEIAGLARLEPGSTVDNALSRLIKAEKIHRPTEGGKEIRGKYGLGPAPDTDDDMAP